MEKKGGSKYTSMVSNKKRTLKIVSGKPKATSKLRSKFKSLVKTVKLLRNSNVKNETVILNTFEIILKLIIKNDQKLTYKLMSNRNHTMGEELSNFDMFKDEINDKLDDDILNKIKNKSTAVYELLEDNSRMNLETIELYTVILKKLRMMRSDKSLSKSLSNDLEDVQKVIANDLNEEFEPLKRESKANNGLNGLAGMFKSLKVKEDSSIDDLMDAFKSFRVEH